MGTNVIVTLITICLLIIIMLSITKSLKTDLKNNHEKFNNLRLNNPGTIKNQLEAAQNKESKEAKVIDLEQYRKQKEILLNKRAKRDCRIK